MSRDTDGCLTLASEKLHVSRGENKVTTEVEIRALILAASHELALLHFICRCFRGKTTLRCPQ